MQLVLNTSDVSLSFKLATSLPELADEEAEIEAFKACTSVLRAHEWQSQDEACSGLIVLLA